MKSDKDMFEQVMAITNAEFPRGGHLYFADVLKIFRGFGSTFEESDLAALFKACVTVDIGNFLKYILDIYVYICIYTYIYICI